MGRKKHRWFDWNAIVPNGPYHPGCALHDGWCVLEGELHRYLAPHGLVALELCDNHVTKLDPEHAGFEVTYAPVTEEAALVGEDQPATSGTPAGG